MRHLVVGTAGHIDHGKSSLVRALTGIDPDRLKDERARGITIELGFADLALDDERVVSFVDVPGHERFVRHMVAGATGIDAVVLVVATDEGVQPQTREHLAICSLLGVRDGVVVLSKADRVDRELAEVVRLEVEDALEGSFLESAPIVSASIEGEPGTGAVVEELGRLFERAPRRAADGVARLPIDRSFVLRGFGTVVTGTLASGSLEVGGEVEIHPGGASSRVRGMQVHGHTVDRAVAGQRVAVNLQGVSCDEAPRGATIADPGRLVQTRRIWGRLALVPDAPESLRHGGEVRFHQGTAERDARFRVLEERDDGRFDVELFLAADATLVPGDRFILRRPAPVDTVGGGEILDVRPPRGRAARHDALRTATDATGATRVRLVRAGRAGYEPGILAAELGVTPDETVRRVDALVEAGEAVRAAGRVLDAGVVEALADAVVAAVEEFHTNEPLAEGPPREDTRSRVCPETPNDAWRALLERWVDGGRLRLVGDRLASASHRVVMSDDDQRLADRVERALREGGLDPPTPESAASDAGAPVERLEGVVDVLRRSGRVVKLGDGRWFHAEALDGMYARLREHARETPSIDVSTFKELFGITRRNAIPLLEHLDATRRTRRVGNVREILEG